MNASVLFLLIAPLIVHGLPVPADGTTLSGVVMDAKTRAPIAQAEVTAVGGRANPDVTDSKGKFVLRLAATVKPGETVELRVRKIGYTTYDEKIAAGELALLIELQPVNPPVPEHPNAPTNRPSGASTTVATPPMTTGPMFSETSDKFSIVAGQISTFLTPSFPTSCLVGLGNTCLVRGTLVASKFVVDATLYAAPGKGNVEVIKNELHKDMPEWDRCYDDTALEIVDENLVPVFHMVYTTPHDIVIYGIFHVGNVVAVLSPHGLDFHAVTEVVSLEDYPVTRLFKYPSQTYHCTRNNSTSSAVPKSETSGPYRRLESSQFCAEVVSEAAKITGMADDCFTRLVASSNNKEPVAAQNRIRKDFSDEFMKCCSQSVRDMHKELLFRLKPLVESQDESVFREMDNENRYDPTGVVLTTVERIAVYLRTSCDQLSK